VESDIAVGYLDRFRRGGGTRPQGGAGEREQKISEPDWRFGRHSEVKISTAGGAGAAVAFVAAAE